MCFFYFFLSRCHTGYSSILPWKLHKNRFKDFFKPLHLSATALEENSARSQHLQCVSITCSPNIKAKGTKDSTLQLIVSHTLKYQLANCSLDRRSEKKKPPSTINKTCLKIFGEWKNAHTTVCCAAISVKHVCGSLEVHHCLHLHGT